MSCLTCKYFVEDKEVSTIGRCIFSGGEGFNLYRENNNCNSYNRVVSLLIRNTIRDEIYNTRWSNCWLSRDYVIQNKLKELNPDVPKDNTVGCIAFDVPNKARMKIRTQRFLTRKLNLNSGYLPDHLISNIANKINSVLFPDIRTEIIKGKDITECYRKSIGGGSCMTGSCCNFTKLYEMNPDKIQMLIMYYMNDSARAILYKLDNNKGYYLDRVYASCILLENKMFEYADNNNWFSYRNLRYKTYEEKDNLVISDLEYEDGYVPYMDTFDGSISNNRLTLSRDGDFCMDSTSGYMDGDGGYSCESCGGHIHEDNVTFIHDSGYCESCVNEYFIYCEHCNEYESSDDAVRIEDKDIYVCEHCANNHYVQCEDCSCYIEDDYAIVEGDKSICSECLENSDKYIQCIDCNEWFYEENIEDGYCKDCKPEDEPEEDDIEEDEHSTHADDPRPYISCKIEDTKELSFEENE